jgi:hypothetical protein
LNSSLSALLASPDNLEPPLGCTGVEPTRHEDIPIHLSHSQKLSGRIENVGNS